MRRTQATGLKCMDAVRVIVHDGAQTAIDSGVHNKVKCPSCGSIYETDVQFNGIGLTAGKIEWFET